MRCLAEGRGAVRKPGTEESLQQRVTRENQGGEAAMLCSTKAAPLLWLWPEIRTGSLSKWTPGCLSLQLSRSAMGSRRRIRNCPGPWTKQLECC